MAAAVSKTIVIGVDFGTTFSGIALAIDEGNGPGDVEVMRRWPDNTGGRRASDKVPTKLRRLGNSDAQWGFLIPPDAPSNEVLQWFKL